MKIGNDTVVYMECETHPAETRIISGLNLWAHGTIISSNTVLMAVSPEPPGRGRFSVVPSPSPWPTSPNLPVPG